MNKQDVDAAIKRYESFKKTLQEYIENRLWDDERMETAKLELKDTELSLTALKFMRLMMAAEAWLYPVIKNETAGKGKEETVMFIINECLKEVQGE